MLSTTHWTHSAPVWTTVKKCHSGCFSSLIWFLSLHTDAQLANMAPCYLHSGCHLHPYMWYAFLFIFWLLSGCLGITMLNSTITKKYQTHNPRSERPLRQYTDSHPSIKYIWKVFSATNLPPTEDSVEWRLIHWGYFIHGADCSAFQMPCVFLWYSQRHSIMACRQVYKGCYPNKCQLCA